MFGLRATCLPLYKTPLDMVSSSRDWSCTRPDDVPSLRHRTVDIDIAEVVRVAIRTREATTRHIYALNDLDPGLAEKINTLTRPFADLFEPRDSAEVLQLYHAYKDAMTQQDHRQQSSTTRTNTTSNTGNNAPPGRKVIEGKRIILALESAAHPTKLIEAIRPVWSMHAMGGPCVAAARVFADADVVFTAFQELYRQHCAQTLNKPRLDVLFASTFPVKRVVCTEASPALASLSSDAHGTTTQRPQQQVFSKPNTPTAIATARDARRKSMFQSLPADIIETPDQVLPKTVGFVFAPDDEHDAGHYYFSKNHCSNNSKNYGNDYEHYSKQDPVDRFRRPGWAE